MQLADAGRSPGGESSWPELVNIANGVSCSNTQQHHWSRQWDRAPGVTAAYCCSFGFELSLGAQHSMRHYRKKLSATRWHGVRLHLTTLASISNTMSIQVVIVVSCGQGRVRRHVMQKNRYNMLQPYKAWELRQPLRIASGELRSMMQRHLSRGQLLPSGPVQISWPQGGLIWFDHRVAQLSAVGFTDRRLSR